MRVGSSTDDAPGPPNTPYAKISALLEAPEPRAAARSLFGAELGAISFGLPRADEGSLPVASRGPEVLVTCAGVLASDQDALVVALRASSAAALVDRVLGGSGALGVAAKAGQLSDAECGVLAYAVARLLSATDTGLCVRDVAAADEHSASFAAARIEWPCALKGPLGTLELRVLLSERSALASTLCFELELSVEDSIPLDTLHGLAKGDVLVSDRISLTATSRGLAGPAFVSARGMVGKLAVTLEGGRAEVARTAPSVAPVPAPLRFVLARRSVTLRALARIASGGEPAFTSISPGEVEVLHSGVAVGAGELVTVRGALGVRLTRCGSAATPARPPA